MQVCPAFIVMANQIRSAALRTSASARTSAESCPLSSSTDGIKRAAAVAATAAPTRVPPVNITLSNIPSRTSRSPASAVASASASHPSGNPHDAASRTSSCWECGERSEGFTVTRLPAITACTSCTPSSPTG